MTTYDVRAAIEADQAHLIREFKDLGGSTPNRFLARASPILSALVSGSAASVHPPASAGPFGKETSAAVSSPSPFPDQPALKVERPSEPL